MLTAQKTAQLANALLARLLTVTHPANAGPKHGSAMPTVTELLRTSVLTSAATTTDGGDCTEEQCAPIAGACCTGRCML